MDKQVSCVTSASHEGGEPVHRERLLPRDPVERGALRHGAQPPQESTLRLRWRRPQVTVFLKPHPRTWTQE
jgi:hypothetical protein